MSDIVSISDNVAYPDILLTITSSLQRPENKNALLPAQSVTDSPDSAAVCFV